MYGTCGWANAVRDDRTSRVRAIHRRFRIAIGGGDSRTRGGQPKFVAARSELRTLCDGSPVIDRSCSVRHLVGDGSSRRRVSPVWLAMDCPDADFNLSRGRSFDRSALSDEMFPVALLFLLDSRVCNRTNRNSDILDFATYWTAPDCVARLLSVAGWQLQIPTNHEMHRRSRVAVG